MLLIREILSTFFRKCNGCMFDFFYKLVAVAGIFLFFFIFYKIQNRCLGPKLIFNTNDSLQIILPFYILIILA